MQFADLLPQVRCRIGESPVYDERTNTLWFCDIPACRVYGADLATLAVAAFDFPTEVGSLGLARSGRLVVALRHEVRLFDPHSGRSEIVASIEADNPETRLNDGRVGPDGAFWVGSMDEIREGPHKRPIGSLYRVSPSGAVERKITDVRVSNGLAFSQDGTKMFHSDSRGLWIDRWTFDARTGAIGDRIRIATPDEAFGRPDGGTTDIADTYWTAGVSSGRLNRLSFSGQRLATVELPVAAPTMACFGGPRLQTIFLTSLRQGLPVSELTSDRPNGGILAAETDATGFLPALFEDA